MWQDILIGSDLIGESIDRGTGYYKKSYTYIFVPGENYKGYCFLLSSNCVYENLISIKDNMNIELFMHPDNKADNKKYKRYRMTGAELIENILGPYEDNLYVERAKRQREEAEKQKSLDKKKKGNIVYGHYYGSIYDQTDNFRDFFFHSSSGTFFNKYHEKARNVKISFVVMEDVSKYFFKQVKDILDKRLKDYIKLMDILEQLETLNNQSEISLIKEQIHTLQESTMNKLIRDLKNYEEKNI